MHPSIRLWLILAALSSVCKAAPHVSCLFACKPACAPAYPDCLTTSMTPPPPPTVPTARPPRAPPPASYCHMPTAGALALVRGGVAHARPLPRPARAHAPAARRRPRGRPAPGAAAGEWVGMVGGWVPYRASTAGRMPAWKHMHMHEHTKIQTHTQARARTHALERMRVQTCERCTQRTAPGFCRDPSCTTKMHRGVESQMHLAGLKCCWGDTS